MAHDPAGDAEAAARAQEAEPRAESALPPEPTMRSISPAPEDYTSPPALSVLLWPLFWIAALALLWAGISSARPAEEYYEAHGHGPSHGQEGDRAPGHREGHGEEHGHDGG